MKIELGLKVYPVTVVLETKGEMEMLFRLVRDCRANRPDLLDFREQFLTGIRLRFRNTRDQREGKENER